MQFIVLGYLALLFFAVALIPAAVGFILLFTSTRGVSRPWFGAWAGGVLGYIGYSAFVLCAGAGMASGYQDHRDVARGESVQIFLTVGFLVFLPCAATLGSLHGSIAGWCSAAKCLSPPAIPAHRGPPLPRQRTGGMIAIANINLVYGGVGMAAGFLVLMAAGPLTADTLKNLGGTQPGRFLLASSLIALFLTVSAIVAGIGILKIASWGRRWTLVYAIGAIVCAPLSWWVDTRAQALFPNPSPEGVMMWRSIFGCVYPTMLLFVANTKRWKVIFGPKAPTSPTS